MIIIALIIITLGLALVIGTVTATGLVLLRLTTWARNELGQPR